MGFLRRRRKQGETMAHDIGELYDAEDRQMKAWDTMLEQRPPAEAPGIDITPITRADPSFNDQDFLAIVRECFYLMRKARTTDNMRVADGVVSPQLERELREAVRADVAAHRHYLLPGLEAETAAITSAMVDNGKLVITVRMHIWCGDQTMEVPAGIERGTDWNEEWTAWRDPTLDASMTDHDHALRRQEEGQWLFAHKGWVVIAISRDGADATTG